MNTIRFHRVDNTDYPRYHGIWYKRFAKFCEQYFHVEWINYATTSDQGSAHIQLIHEIPKFGNTPPLGDTDCVIENVSTGEFVLLTFTEYFNHYAVHYMQSDNCQLVLTAHFSWHNIYHWLRRDGLLHKMHRVSPWFFGSSQEYDIPKFRELRRNTDTLDPKLFYKGSGITSYRIAVQELSQMGLVDITTTGTHSEYMNKLATAKCALSYYMDLDKYTTPFNHPGEFCYRDMEYMALGVPFIRIEYKDAVYNGLVPNKHYISIPREHAHKVYAERGNIGVAELIASKYQEVIGNDAFLEYITRNQLEWFDTFALWPNSAEFTINISGIGDWI